MDVETIVSSLAEEFSPDQYYSKVLKRTNEFQPNIDILTKFYRARMMDNPIRLEETIVDYYLKFRQRGMDGFEVLASTIAMVGNKGDNGKKVIPYLIGCLRNQMNYGPVATGSEVEAKLIPILEEKMKLKLSIEGHTQAATLAARYGCFEMVLALAKNSYDPESFFFLWLEDVLQHTEDEKNDITG